MLLYSWFTQAGLIKITFSSHEIDGQLHKCLPHDWHECHITIFIITLFFLQDGEKIDEMLKVKHKKKLQYLYAMVCSTYIKFNVIFLLQIFSGSLAYCRATAMQLKQLLKHRLVSGLVSPVCFFVLFLLANWFDFGADSVIDTKSVDGFCSCG